MTTWYPQKPPEKPLKQQPNEETKLSVMARAIGAEAYLDGNGGGQASLYFPYRAGRDSYDSQRETLQAQLAECLHSEGVHVGHEIVNHAGKAAIRVELSGPALRAYSNLETARDERNMAQGPRGR